MGEVGARGSDATDRDRAIWAGHYVFSDPQFLSIRADLLQRVHMTSRELDVALLRAHQGVPAPSPPSLPGGSLMRRRVAVIILSRNLPEAVDRLVRGIRRYDLDDTDIYVIEAGTDRDKLSEHHTTWANWPEAMREGLRPARGFNLGIRELINGGRLHEYDYLFLMRATVHFDGPVVSRLLDQLEEHPRVGIISPCGDTWPERELIGPDSLRYVWHINHHAWMLRRSFVDRIIDHQGTADDGPVFDGSNFRSYGTDTELIVKGYINDYATALSTACSLSEDPELLKSRADLIRTDPYDVNARKVFDEGFQWMRRKYGFTTRLQFQEYARLWYDRFFVLHPWLTPYRLLPEDHVAGPRPSSTRRRARADHGARAVSGARVTGAAATGPSGSTGVVSLQERRACAACGASDLDPLLEITGVPVHMGCTEQPREQDVFYDQRWATCTRCGSVQLSALAPLDLVYQSQHNAAVGGVWARHHTALANFVAARAPRTVVEVGGASGALAREYTAQHDVDAWTVVEPNPRLRRSRRST